MAIKKRWSIVASSVFRKASFPQSSLDCLCRGDSHRIPLKDIQRTAGKRLNDFNTSCRSVFEDLVRNPLPMSPLHLFFSRSKLTEFKTFPILASGLEKGR